ncbi:hypothetical protein B0H19DRAFT_1251448 [Mycena capillaripes]|nr:hypothetical protein B0H19DRAFT_1251448 [Mycena capillaripes]
MWNTKDWSGSRVEEWCLSQLFGLCIEDMPRSIVLSNGRTDYQQQNSIVRGVDGCLYIAPINRFALTLPPELTSEIFLHCLPNTEFIRPDPYSAPLLLCRICRQWRRIALDTPELWASLYIDLDWFFPKGLPLPKLDPEALDSGVFFGEWISNARSMPLSVHVEDDPTFDTDPLALEEVGPVLNMLGLRSSQWRKLVLRVAPEYFRNLQPCDITFPWLKHLAVPHVQLTETPWMFDIPWIQLTVFRSEKISVSDCIYVLREAPSLLSCTFYLYPDSYPVRAAALPPLKLQVLEITEKTTKLLTLTLLQHLTLPALQDFTLRFDTTRHIHRDIGGLISFASRSILRRLRQLTLCLVPVPEALLIECLHAFPSVLDLRLQLHKAADDLLRHFECDVNLLPHLQTLHIVQNLPHRTVPNAMGLLEMLAKRWEHSDFEVRQSAKLRSFRFDHSGSKAMVTFATSVYAHQRFQLLKDQGLELHLGEASQYDKRAWYVRCFEKAT